MRAVRLDGTLPDSFEADAQAYIHMFAALGEMEHCRVETALLAELAPRVPRARLPRAKWADADRLWMKFYVRISLSYSRERGRVLSALERRFILARLSSGSGARVRRATA